MLKKILLLLLILLISYGILIYLNPNFTIKLEKIFGLNFTEKLIKYKSSYDNVITNIPSKEEFIKAKNNITNAIGKTKDTIDDIRAGVKQLEDKYDDAKVFIEETGDKINNAKKQIGDFKDKLSDIDELGNSIKNIVNTGVVDEVILN